MENEDKKYVVLGSNEQILVKSGKDMGMLALHDELMQMVFRKEEACKWSKNRRIYELVPVDFSDKE